MCHETAKDLPNTTTGMRNQIALTQKGKMGIKEKVSDGDPDDHVGLVGPAKCYRADIYKRPSV